MAKTTVAIMYDFDKTLSTTDMQEYDFIKNLGMTPKEFWSEAGKLTDEMGMDKILAYMLVMVNECKKKGIKLTREYLNECGKNVKYYNGVSTWFDRINQFGADNDVNIEHYIISSGNKEILEGTSIAKYFKKIYGCEFYYDENGEAAWPAMAINFTLKTQFIFRISKGVLDVRDDASLNKHTEDRAVPYSNLIYIGDGLTDIPSMRVVKDKGGVAIAVYPSGDKHHVEQLVKESRINFVYGADYSQGSGLENTVRLCIENIAIRNKMQAKEEQLRAKYMKEYVNEN